MGSRVAFGFFSASHRGNPGAGLQHAPPQHCRGPPSNATPFGLGGAVFTQDVARGERLALEGLETGLAFVNDFGHRGRQWTGAHTRVSTRTRTHNPNNTPQNRQSG